VIGQVRLRRTKEKKYANAECCGYRRNRSGTLDPNCASAVGGDPISGQKMHNIEQFAKKMLTYYEANRQPRHVHDLH
jgi:hypothetical protein